MVNALESDFEPGATGAPQHLQELPSCILYRLQHCLNLVHHDSELLSNKLKLTKHIETCRDELVQRHGHWDIEEELLSGKIPGQIYGVPLFTKDTKQITLEIFMKGKS